ncbi:aldo/keto reductase [Actinosynnema sp. NPDC004786]
MRTRRLGRSSVEVTALGFGGAGVGNLARAVDDGTAAATVAAAWSAGVRYFDTAPHYGLGLSERRVGEALRRQPRDSYVLSTKVGRLLVPGPGAPDDAGFAVTAPLRRRWDFTADGVRRSLEGSLARLGLDRVDVVLIHDPDDHLAAALDGAYPALHELRAQGVVGAVGVGMNQWQALDRFVRDTDLDVVMVAGRYTLLDQSAGEVLLPRCLDRGVSVLAAGVFNSGLLATDTPAGPYDYRPAPPALVERAGAIAARCAAHGVALPQAAMAFAARHPAVAGIVVGAQDAEQVRRNATLFATPVPDALWADLAEAGLLHDPRRG